jgi:hypothetical protein
MALNHLTDQATQVDVDSTKEFYESGEFYSPKYVVENTLLPEDGSMPNVFYFTGPARGGTSALLMALCGLPEFDSLYFQPHKHSIRHGAQIDLRNTGGKLVGMKDTFGPLFDHENFDPFAMLEQAGVPQQNMVGVLSLRDPIATWKSLQYFTDRMDPEFFAATQKHTIDLYHRYLAEGMPVVPFTFDLLGHEAGVPEVMRRLLNASIPGLGENFNPTFDDAAIDAKMVWGEAEDPTYYGEVITPTRKRGSFAYVGGTKHEAQLPESEVELINRLCRDDYNQFRLLAADHLGLEVT